MNKYMLADFIKELNQYDIDRFMRYYDVTEAELPKVLSLKDEYRLLDTELEQSFQMYMLMRDYQTNADESFYLVDNWHNEAEWKDVMATAEALDLGIEDINDDDVEEYLSTGGSDEIDTSLGNTIYHWDNIAKAYVIWIALDNGSNIQQYKNVPRDMVQAMKSADSSGQYYNDYLRGNESYEGCGCKANVCEASDLAQIPRKYIDKFNL